MNFGNEPRSSSQRRRILLIADRPNWVYDRKATNLKRRFREFDVDVGYVESCSRTSHWLQLFRSHHFDVLWYLGYRLGRSPAKRLPTWFSSFVKKQNQRGTAVVASVTNALMHFEVPSAETSLSDRDVAPSITAPERELLGTCFDEQMARGKGKRLASDIKRLQVYNRIAVNNKFAFQKLRAHDIDCDFLPDGVDRRVFRCDVPVADRKFGVLFVSSIRKQEHKGMEIFRALSERLQPMGIETHAVIADSYNNVRSLEEMSEIYNGYPIYICASKAEGGPATLLEASACGCVTITTPVGYSNEIVGQGAGCIVPRNVDAFLQKILHLRDNSQLLQEMSKVARQTIGEWDWDIQARAHEGFLVENLL